jgi:thymidylate synthase
MKYTNKDGTPFSKEEFLQKLKTDNEFNNEFGNKGVDQISELIKQLKENPDSRRLMVSAWNVDELHQMALPPCHYGFQVYTRELSLEERIDIRKKETKNGIIDYDNKNHNYLDHFNVPRRAISLMWNQRSVDTPLGLPFNIASYALLLEIFGRMVNMVPDELIGNLGDVHIYKNQIDSVSKQIDRESYDLPELLISNEVNFKGSIDDFLNSCNQDSFTINNYKSHSSIKIPLSN